MAKWTTQSRVSRGTHVLDAIQKYRDEVKASNRKTLQWYVQHFEHYASSSIRGKYPSKAELGQFFAGKFMLSTNGTLQYNFGNHIKEPADILLHFDTLVDRFGLDGTLANTAAGDPPASDTDREHYFSIVQQAINDRAPDYFKGPLLLPEDLKILVANVDQLIGPGLPQSRVISQVPFFDGVTRLEDWELHNRVADFMDKTKIDLEVGRLEDNGWDIEAGWICGTNRFEGDACAMYCRNVAKGKDWSWRYCCVACPRRGAIILDDLGEFLGWYSTYNEMSEEKIAYFAGLVPGRES